MLTGVVSAETARAVYGKNIIIHHLIPSPFMSTGHVQNWKDIANQTTYHAVQGQYGGLCSPENYRELSHILSS